MLTLFFRSGDSKWSLDGRAWYPSPELALTARRGSLVVYERARRSFTVTVDEEQWYLYDGYRCTDGTNTRTRTVRVPESCDSRLLAVAGLVPTRPGTISGAWSLPCTDGYALLGAYPVARFDAQAPQFRMSELRRLFGAGRLEWSFHDPFRESDYLDLLMGVEVEAGFRRLDIPHRRSYGGDGSLRYTRALEGAELGELRSPVMPVQSMLGWLVMLALRSDWSVNSTCGGHVHFSRATWQYLDDVEGLPLDGFISDAVEFFQSRSRRYASRLEARRRNSYCRSIRWSDVIERARQRRYERYRAWNLECYPEKGVEFRLPPGIERREATREYAWLLILLAERLGEQNLTSRWVRVIPSATTEYVVETIYDEEVT